MIKISCLLLIVCLSLQCLAHVEFAGITREEYNGRMIDFFQDQNGYDDAKLACEKDFGEEARVCVDSEVGIIAQTDSLNFLPFKKGVRFIDMALSFDQETGFPVNDCRGFTSNSTDVFSPCIKHILGGPILPSVCSCEKILHLMCCFDY
eukprot:TRINITY_DN9863_c0_g1_i1.p1 TRINITY_DN9863_c0_g1~~TRINITY_DN9863_c0_g1_i1.p1  ORF type:complete len:149 (-),score=19.73 TRINITY_DN9863_c0_g1_i1:46-492(-)